MSAAIAGSDVAMTVESMFSMKRAVATISGMMRCLSTMTDWNGNWKRARIAAYHRYWTATIADRRMAPKSCVTPGWGASCVGERDDLPEQEGRGRRPPARAAAGYPGSICPKKPVHGWPAVRIALIRRPPVLSTRVNPTDGLRFSGVAARYAEGGAHPYLFAAGPRK